MFAQYIDKNQVRRPTNPIFSGGKAYSNPDEKTLRALGYKELVVLDMPEVPQGKIAVPVYTDGKVITQGWELIDDEFAE